MLNYNKLLPLLFCCLAVKLQLVVANPKTVTVCEDQYSSNYLVATSDLNYAILFGPQPNPMNWESVSVKPNKVVAVTRDKVTKTSSYSSLNETARNLIEEIYYKLSQDLAFPALQPQPLKEILKSESGNYQLPLSISTWPFEGKSTRKLQTSPRSKNKKLAKKASLKKQKPLQEYKILPYTTNYHNLGGSLLNETLLGDVYIFDLSGNILEVYSTSVSICQRANLRSILHRDSHYFTYSRPEMPLEINRIFLVKNHVFFIYHDGSVFVKSNWQLDYVELDLITDAKLEIKELTQVWPYSQPTVAPGTDNYSLEKDAEVYEKIEDLPAGLASSQ